MNSKLNGSVQRLAAALGDVVSDAVEAGREDMRKEIQEIRSDMTAMEERLGNRIDGLASEVRETEERLNIRMGRMVEDIVAEKQIKKSDRRAEA